MVSAMRIITGGAGFIGSVIQEFFYRKGEPTAIIDALGADGKWRNLRYHPPLERLPPMQGGALWAALDEWVGRLGVSAVIHMGAVSSTTAADGDEVWAANVALPQLLWRWCAEREVPFIYASSAATYGAAFSPGDFCDGLAGIDGLRPLNLYGFSKQSFDLWVKKQVEIDAPRPRQWVGLKFFNVYGPNEYHKASQASVALRLFSQIRRGESPKLFRSSDPDIRDGWQKRDFLWVGDIPPLIGWLLENPGVSGLFNVGSGRARSFLELAACVRREMGLKPGQQAVSFVDMPESLRPHYQNYSCADLSSLRQAGYSAAMASLEEGVAEYVQEYLLSGETL